MKRNRAITLAFLAASLIFTHLGSAQDKVSDGIQKKAGTDSTHAKPLPPPVLLPNAIPNRQNPGASIAPKDIEQPIRLETPVAVNSIKDRWDKALVIFTGLIIAVGIFQIIFLWWTVDATRDNAKAVKVQTQHLRDADRPWFFMAPDKRFVPQESHKLDWIISNSGRTVGTLIEAKLRCLILAQGQKKLPTLPEYGAVLNLHGVPLAPTDAISVWWDFEKPGTPSDISDPKAWSEGKYMTSEDAENILAQNSELIVFGSVTYREGTKGVQHESRFCFYYAVPFSEFRINLRAPAEYHRCD